MLLVIKVNSTDRKFMDLQDLLCYSPPWINCRAMKRAVDPVEQLLLTLVMGIPVRPRL